MKNSPSLHLYRFTMKMASVLLPLAGLYSKKNYDVILCYHDVCSDKWKFSISKERFEEHIKMLVDKFCIVGLSEIVKTRNKTGKVRIAITFDDGYQNVYKYAFPVLKKYGATGALFVIGNKNAKPKQGFKSVLATVNQIRLLGRYGWDIGWHTYSHRNLRQLTIRQQSDELIRTKKRFEEKVGFSFPFLAYPYGSYNAISKRLAKKYLAAFTINGGRANRYDMQAINRVTVTGDVDVSQLLVLISPIGLLFNGLFCRAWKLKDNFTT